MQSETRSSERPTPRYQGAAKSGQREVIRALYDRICNSYQTGDKVAYTFVQPGAPELMRSFGLHAVALPEIQALQCAVKGVHGNLIAKAQEAGYSDDVCGYIHIDVGLMESGLQHPFGKIPPPDIVVCPTDCNTWIKWSEIWAERFHAPVFLLDHPIRFRNLDSYWGSEDFNRDRRYLLSQLEDLIAGLEKLTGKKFDPDRLAECEQNSNRVADLWDEIRAMNRRIPAVWDGHEDALYYMGAGISGRGSALPVAFFEAVKKELEERIQLGLYPAAPQKFRIGVTLAPCWSKLPAFISLFKKRAAAVVWTGYSDFLTTRGHRYDPSRPLESLAEGFLMYNVRGNNYRGVDWLPHIEEAYREFHLDGIVLHVIKSCRNASTGIADYRNHLQRQGIPTVVVESDLVDNRYFSEAQMRNRIDAFLEALEHRKLTGGESHKHDSPDR